MSKSIRNTFFTAILLVLTGLGVSWNEEVARQRNPVAIGEIVLAEFSAGEQATGDIKLDIELSRSQALLGQTQVVTINTLPFTDLNLAVRLPDGSFDDNLTRRVSADELGRYNWLLPLSDFKMAGQIEVFVMADLKGQTAASRKTFSVQTWQVDKLREEFLYPLVP